MECWEEGPTTTQMERELQCRCSVGKKDQKQHICRGSCNIDVALAVIEPWAAV